MPKITWADLPEEIKEKMLEHQKAQTGKRDESVFIKDIHTARPYGGFTWYNTWEGKGFWSDIIDHGNFETFFQRYPKPTPKQEEEVLTASKEYKHYPEPVEMLVSDYNDQGSNWMTHKVICEIGLNFWAITEDSGDLNPWVYAKPIPQKIKLTAKDVSEGKGVGIQPELIEFVC